MELDNEFKQTVIGIIKKALDSNNLLEDADAIKYIVWSELESIGTVSSEAIIELMTSDVIEPLIQKAQMLRHLGQ